MKAIKWTYRVVMAFLFFGLGYCYHIGSDPAMCMGVGAIMSLSWVQTEVLFND